VKLAVISDVHGNLPALEAFFRISRRHVSGYISLGDVVGFGPWSAECLQLVNSKKFRIKILGNHERYDSIQSLGNVPAIVTEFYSHTGFFADSANLEGWKELDTINTVNFSHTIHDLRIYWDTQVNFSLENHHFIGHSHQQYIRPIGIWNLINPGSLGQNRADLGLGQYAIWDSSSGAVSLESFRAPTSPIISKMRLENYPKNCIDYYLSKVAN